MRVFRVAVLLGVMAVPAAGTAHAQMTPGFRLNDEKTMTEEEKARAKAYEDAAKAARAKIPDAKPNADRGPRSAATSGQVGRHRKAKASGAVAPGGGDGTGGRLAECGRLLLACDPW